MRGLFFMDNIYIDESVKIGKDVKIFPFNVVIGNTTIGDNTILYPFNFIQDSIIGSGCEVSHSHLQNCEIEDEVKVGPFARLRPNTKICKKCKIGNFVEVKNSILNTGVKASHLAYIGDAEVGENANVGCGVIFANYNGKVKNKIKVGKNCFLGSNCNLIAPLSVADKTYICAGSTLTKDTNVDDFVIARQRETIKPNRANKYLKEND